MTKVVRGAIEIIDREESEQLVKEAKENSVPLDSGMVLKVTREILSELNINSIDDAAHAIGHLSMVIQIILSAITDPGDEFKEAIRAIDGHEFGLPLAHHIFMSALKESIELFKNTDDKEAHNTDGKLH